MVVPKKNKAEIRICGDYRDINKVTVKDRYNVPTVDTILQSVKGRYFSNLDLKEGFLQVPMHDDDKP